MTEPFDLRVHGVDCRSSIRDVCAGESPISRGKRHRVEGANAIY